MIRAIIEKTANGLLEKNKLLIAVIIALGRKILRINNS